MNTAGLENCSFLLVLFSEFSELVVHSFLELTEPAELTSV